MKGSLDALRNASNLMKMNTKLADDKRTFKALVVELEERFETLGGKDRFTVLESLLSLVDEPLDEQKRRAVSSPEYRPNDARDLRDFVGFSREKLAPLVELHPLTIYKLEKGRLPFNIKKKKHKKYLDWLCSQGYEISPKA